MGLSEILNAREGLTETDRLNVILFFEPAPPCGSKRDDAPQNLAALEGGIGLVDLGERVPPRQKLIQFQFASSIEIDELGNIDRRPA